MAAKNPVIEIEDDDDETFFSLAMAAEAEALASKRRRITPPSRVISSAPNLVSDDHSNDGLYTAALKGNQNIALPRTTGYENVAGGGGGGGGSCFKCGKLGHWARDCDSGGGGGQSGNLTSGSFTDSSVAEKNCPCGLGLCLVLTANTEKNPGRKFYKCPARQENGGCGFFEWCDSASSGPNSVAGGSYGSNSSLYPGLDCPCGAGLCLTLTAKTGKNVGQQFYRCPSNEGSSCGFFKWCNENSQSPGFSASKVYGNSINTNANNTTNYTAKTGSSLSSSCFKCGKGGHWARDCPSTLSSNHLPQMGGSSSSGSCFKCGKPGHWSRDCTFA